VEKVFQILKETLEKGERVKISGFGNFVIREKRPRRGRNPQSGEEMMISGRRILTFKPSAILRKAVNQGG
jgi:integration host factor subunit alpha